MESNLNVKISLPQSELNILKELAKALGWNLFVQEEQNPIDNYERRELINKLYHCIQLPEDFDYKKELELAINEKYK